MLVAEGRPSLWRVTVSTTGPGFFSRRYAFLCVDLQEDVTENAFRYSLRGVER